jgi:hypothetical protein
MAFAIQASASRGADDVVERFQDINDNQSLYVVGGALQALGVVLLAFVLRYLYRATKYRREELPRGVWPLATIAPLALGLVAIATTFQQLHVVEHVVSQLPLAPPDAEDIATDEQAKGAGVTLAILGSIAALTLAAAFILISQNARKSGLLSNFIGIIGIIVGAFFVLGPLLGSVLGPIPIVQWFWLGALALLFLGVWPGGRPPAWESGEEEPWPTAQEVREQRADARAARDAEREDEPEEEYEELPDGEPAAPAHPRSKKRKRKRRR